MSGLLGIAAAAGGGIASLFSALTPPITIGGIPLLDFQVPRRMGIGGEQELSISKIPGGQFAIQALGDFPEEFELEGIFQGPTRDQDSSQFALMRKAGVPVQLIGMGVSLTVMIRTFRRVYETGWIAYRMGLVIIPDPPAQQDQSGAGPLGTSVSADATAGINAVASTATSTIADTVLQGAGLGSLATAMDGAASAAASAVQEVSSLATAAAGGLGGNAAVFTTLGLAGAAQNGLAAVQGLIEGGMTTANGLFNGGWSGALSVAAQAGPTLLYATDAAGKLAATMAAGGYVARAAGNLLNAAPNTAALPPASAPGSVMTLAA